MIGEWHRRTVDSAALRRILLDHARQAIAIPREFGEHGAPTPPTCRRSLQGDHHDD